ncbi:hypothetical protein T484DRAFT_1847999 [Baffinella frigidus]|nr:hypothetical protein T484DRAFT_1847999 [Cryptophyta sp. CCMP2293]
MPPRAAAGRRARPDSVDEKDDAQAAVGAKRRPPAKRAEPKSKRPAADSSRTAKDADMDMDIDETGAPPPI